MYESIMSKEKIQKVIFSGSVLRERAQFAICPITKLLLKSGATIQEINCIRKKKKKIKGGKLVSSLNCQAISLVMSDVEGDDLSSIASGITFRDDSTFADALDIIKKYKLKIKIPIEVLDVLRDGAHGKIPETKKKNKIKNYLIANNNNCLLDMEKKAKELGYKVKKIQTLNQP